MKISRIIALLVICCLSVGVYADVDPKATYMKEGVETTEWENIQGEAPLTVRFTSNASLLEPGSTLEWHFNHQGATGSSQLTRYEEDTEFTFVESGTTVVSLLVRLDDEVVWGDSINVTISDSHLEMPNAFSPNGDDANNIYRAKPKGKTGGYKSIVEFHAYIFNRWGQKLYEWTDIDGGWDGTYKGNPVKDGVYYVLVHARGADGKEYNIRRDVNLIRKFNSVTGETGGGNE